MASRTDEWRTTARSRNLASLPHVPNSPQDSGPFLGFAASTFGGTVPQLAAPMLRGPNFGQPARVNSSRRRTRRGSGRAPPGGRSSAGPVHATDPCLRITHSLASAERAVDELLDEHDGHAALAGPLDALEHEVDHERREPERHLVGDDQLRRDRQRAGQCEHLLLATREGAGALRRVGRPARGTSRTRGRSPPCAGRRCRRGAPPSGGSPAPTGRGRCPDPRGCAPARRGGSVRVGLRDVLAVEDDPSAERRAPVPTPRAASVLLPAPFAPSTATTEPSGTSMRHVEQRLDRSVPHVEALDGEQGVAQLGSAVLGGVVDVGVARCCRCPRPLRRRRGTRRAPRGRCGSRRGVPCAMQRPKSSTATELDRPSTIATSCSTSSIEIFSSSTTVRSAAPSCEVSCASRPDDGSSSSTIDGPVARARATSTRRAVPSGSDAAGGVGDAREAEQVDRGGPRGRSRRRTSGGAHRR